MEHANEGKKAHGPKQFRGQWWGRFVSYVKSKYTERNAKKKKETPPERAARLTANATVWMAVFTLILALVGIGTGMILKNQLKEMRSTGEQTDKLICFAEKQAAAAKSFSDSANSINHGIKDAVKQLGSAARNSRDSIKATQNSMRLDQRAWVGITDFNVIEFKKSKLFRVDVRISNSGNTPALTMSEDFHYHFSDRKVLGPEKDWFADVQTEPLGALAPRGTVNLHFGIELEDNVYDEIINQKRWVYLFGEIHYTDVSKFFYGSTKWCLYTSFTEDGRIELLHCQSYDDLK